MLQYVISAVLMVLLGLAVSKGKIQTKLLIGAVVGGLVLTFLMQVTYAYYIGTIPQVLTWAIPALGIGAVISYISATKPERFAPLLRRMVLMPVFAVVLTVAHVYLAIAAIIILPIVVLAPARKELGEAILPALKAAGALGCVSLLLGIGIRAGIWLEILLGLALLLSGLTIVNRARHALLERV